MKIVTSLYGDKYLSLLIVFLASLRKIYSSVEVFIFWSDIEPKLIEPIKNYFNEGAHFININSESLVDNSSQSNYFSAIKSSKVSYFESIYKYIGEDEELVFIDTDIIFVGGISEVFNNAFDIAFTPLEGVRYKYPVNTGIIFIRHNTVTRSLIKNMGEHISNIVRDPVENSISVERYGGADQAAFCRVLDYKSDGRIAAHLVVRDVKKLELPAAFYNNFEAIENIGRTKIIHLKGSWQTILFSGRSLKSISNKGDEASFVYKLFLETFIQTISKIYCEPFLSNHQDKFGVKVPWYFYKNGDQLIANNAKMIVYQILERIYRYFFNRRVRQLYAPLGSIIFKKYSFWLQ